MSKNRLRVQKEKPIQKKRNDEVICDLKVSSNRIPFSRHLLFLPAVSMLLYHHFGPHHLSHQLENVVMATKGKKSSHLS